MIDYSENEVINIPEKIKLAKDSENTVQGFISKDTNFRSNQSQEQFLFDTGVTVCIIGLEVARENKWRSPKNIIEASGRPLDIIGQFDFFIKLSVIGKIKKCR